MNLTKKEIRKSVVAGVTGTVIMTLIIFATVMMGAPKMTPPDMLAAMLGIPVAIGWVMHFMVGIGFALAYTLVFAPKVKLKNILLKGAAFGLAAFVAAQIMLGIMGEIFPMPEPEGSMMLMMIGSVLGHILFGVTVAKLVGAGN